LRWLGEVAAEHGAALYLVGGAVRDRLLGKTTLDIDLACEGGVRKLGHRLARELDSRFVYYPRFGTGTLEGPRGERLDLARTRTERYPRPGEFPTLKPASIKEDLRRRDFTVNAMAYTLTPKDFGRLLDPLGGRKDIEKKLIRVLHRRSFIDDPTRIFRAVRYSERLGFRIEPHTAELLRQAVHAIPALSGERLLYELRCIAGEDAKTRVRVIKRLEKLGALDFLGKPAVPLSAARMGRIEEAETCGFLCLLLSNFEQRRVERLPLKKACLATVATLRHAAEILARLARLETPSQITFFLRDYDARGLGIIARTRKAGACRKITAYLDTYRHVRTKTTGADLKRAGIPQGPRYRELLDRLLAARLDGAARTKRDEQRLLARWIG